MKAVAISTAIIATAISLHSWRAADSQDHQAPTFLPAASAALVGPPAHVALSASPTVAAPAQLAPATPPAAAGESAPEDPMTLRIPGRVQPRTKVAIGAMTSLPVVDVPFKEGQRVTKGYAEGNVPPSVLVKLDEADLQAGLQSAEAKRDSQATEIAVAELRMAVQESQVAAAKISLGEAERQWGRLQQLIASGDTSAASADEARSKFERCKTDYQAVLKEQEASQGHLKAMRDSLKAAEADVDRARVALAAATIVSPIDGVVTRVNVHPGELAVSASNNPGTPLIEVADMDHLVLIARADERAIGKIEVGQKAIVRLKGYDHETFTGTVQRVALAGIEDKDGTAHFRTEISLDTGGRMIPAGVSGEARIDLSAQKKQG